MKERYMIVRIINILAEMKDNNSMITEPCYQIVDKDYETPDSAYRAKEKYRESQHYIVVQYWC
jgi:hypothetical protein